MSEKQSPYHVSTIRDVLDQAGSDQGAMLLGGLRVGQVAPQLGAGDAEITGSVRRSVALSAGVQRGAALNIADATWTAIAFDVENWDTDGLADVAVSPTKLSIHTGGIYSIAGSFQWAANAVGQRLGMILLNGTIILAMVGVQAPAALAPAHAISAAWSLNEGDYLELCAYQNSGAPLGLAVGLPAYGPSFCCARLV